MIDISHNHARRLLRASFDGRIPEEQWAAVHAHMEHCEECRAYRASLTNLERDARKALRTRWEAVSGPESDLLPVVLARRQKREKVRWVAFRAGAGTLALLFFWLVGGVGWLRELFAFAPPPQPRAALVAVTQQPTPTPLPTAQPGDVQALVVFSARRSPSADSDLYLVNPPDAPERLQASAANETDPAWSPDGEWIAYLSDETGKTEVYMTTLAGGTPIRLTSDPHVEWHGPLAFAPDGKSLALTGVRANQGSQSWIYVLPLSGGAPAALPGTRGGWGAEFSPAGGRLAFSKLEGANRGASVYYFHQPRDIIMDSPRHWTSPAGQGAPIGEGVFHFQPETAGLAAPANPTIHQAGLALDWSPDGYGLAYLGSLPEAEGGGARVMVEREMDYATSLQDDYQLVTQIARSRWSGAFQGVTYTPSGAVVFLEDMDDARANDEPGTTPEACWTINMRHPTASGGNPQGSGRTLVTGGLCVESGLDNANWTPDGRWLIVVGRAPGETNQALYAVRVPQQFPGSPLAQDTATPAPRSTAVPENDAIRLSGAGGLFNEGQLTSIPRVRPEQRSRMLAIQPIPVDADAPASAPAPELPPAEGLAEAPGEIVYSIRNNVTSLIIRARPDGTGGRVLAASPGSNRCPRFSPDGDWVAFISNRHPDGTGGGADLLEGDFADALYLMRSSDGSDLTRVTLPVDRPKGIPPAERMRFDCPVWSPDGALIAVTVEVDRQYYLALSPAEPQYRGPTVQFLPIGRPTGVPFWTHDGARLALAHTNPDGMPLLLVATVKERAQVASPGRGYTISSYNAEMPYEMGMTSGPVLSLDGWQAYLLSTVQRPGRQDLAVLRRVSVEGIGERMPLPLGPDAASPTFPGALARLPEGSVGVILRGTEEERFKAHLHTYDLRSHVLQLHASFEDQVYTAVWSPHGDWALLSAESGLWAVKLGGDGESAPVWISPEPVYDMDWRVQADIDPTANDPSSWKNN